MRHLFVVDSLDKPSSDGRILPAVLNFDILDMSPLDIASKPLRRDLCDLRSLRSVSCGSQAPTPLPRPKTFKFLGVACGWWYDREISLLPPITTM